MTTNKEDATPTTRTLRCDAASRGIGWIRSSERPRLGLAKIRSYNDIRGAARGLSVSFHICVE